MSPLDKVPLKVFWETVEERLATYAVEDLRAILRAMAQETRPTERQAFLEKLKPVEEAPLGAEPVIEQEDLLADIDDLAQEIEAAMADADDWEERSGWDDYYHDEDTLGPYEEFVGPLVGLFDRAEAAFDYGHLSLARAAYQKLFEVLSLEDDYGRRVRPYDLTGVDIDEARARYLRAVYETETMEQRPRVLFEQMAQIRLGLMRSRPMLDHLIQISPRPLPDRDQFLTEWIAFLRTQSGSDADAWLREAVRLSQGTPGLESLARTEGQTRPRAYLDWFTALEQEGKQREVLEAAQEALQTLPTSLPIRAAIADHLCSAAARLNEPEALRAGRWQAFQAKPTLARLLDLWEAAPTDTERTALMEQAAQHVQNYLAQPPAGQGVGGFSLGQDDLERRANVSKTTLAHTYLLAEAFEAAYNLAADEKVLGWSSNPQGLVVPFFLVLLSGKAMDQLPHNLAQLWQQGLEASVGIRFSYSGAEDKLVQRMKQVYREQVSKVSLGGTQADKILTWCLEVTQRRVEAIVGNQYRKSYGKAAMLTTACAEALRLRGDRQAATSLVSEMRSRFPRHRAFQAELKTAIEKMERGLR